MSGLTSYLRDTAQLTIRYIVSAAGSLPFAATWAAAVLGGWTSWWLLPLLLALVFLVARSIWKRTESWFENYPARATPTHSSYYDLNVSDQPLVAGVCYSQALQTLAEGGGDSLQWVQAETLATQAVLIRTL